MTPRITIDEIDTKIIYALLKDARASFSEIATECGISTTAVMKRYRKLKQKKVIVGTSIILSIKRLGYQFFVSIALDVDSVQESHVLETFKRLPHLVACIKVIGVYDFHITILAKDFDAVTKVRDLLKRQPGVKTLRITVNIDDNVYFPENLVIEATEIK